MRKAAIYTILDPEKEDSHFSGGFAAVMSVANSFKDLGLECDIITPKKEWKNPKGYDICLYADIFNDPCGSQPFTIQQYASFLETENFIVLECAYTGCTTQPYGLGGKVNNGSYEPSNLSNFTKELMTRSKLNIFLSPLHRLEFCRFLNMDIPNSYNFFQPIDTNIFYNKNYQNRDIPFLFVGALNWFKGLNDAIEIFGDIGLHVVARNSEEAKALPKNVKYLGEFKPNELADIYNRTKRFVHIPRWQEPSARTVVEAALCGCELIVNENVGAMSFGYDIRDPNLSNISKEHLNKVIASVIG